MSRERRSYIAQIRCGILPLHIETGRWININVEERTCKVCNQDIVEDETHFIFNCPKYSYERAEFISMVEAKNPEFITYDNIEKFKFFMTKDCISVFGKFLQKIYTIRKSILYAD